MQILSTEWVTLPHDDSAQFEIRGLTGLEFMALQAEMRRSIPGGGLDQLADGKVPLSPEMMRITLQGVRCWRGVINADGNNARFGEGAAEALDFRTVQALASMILDRTLIAEDAEKN